MKNTYTVELKASDGALDDTITVTITVTDRNEAPSVPMAASLARSRRPQTTPLSSQDYWWHRHHDRHKEKWPRTPPPDTAIGAPVDGHGRGRRRHIDLHAGRR